MHAQRIATVGILLAGKGGSDVDTDQGRATVAEADVVVAFTVVARRIVATADEDDDVWNLEIAPR